MNDSVDIKTAADRLQSALKSLEGELSPLLDKVSKLERIAREAESFETDRAALASSLDQAKSREAEFTAREAEFTKLADATTQELDTVIRQVQKALAKDGDA
ncbi:DUF4164 family protein [Fretibacter rubidus]|uniref:DUF4164 family protein n=1 Tax=Fretibacter rubidus TaxID=570162 RepID=UPI00352B1459